MRKILESDYNTYIPWAKDSIANAVYPCSIAESFQSGDIPEKLKTVIRYPIKEKGSR